MIKRILAVLAVFALAVSPAWAASNNGNNGHGGGDSHGGGGGNNGGHGGDGGHGGGDGGHGGGDGGHGGGDGGHGGGDGGHGGGSTGGGSASTGAVSAPSGVSSSGGGTAIPTVNNGRPGARASTMQALAKCVGTNSLVLTDTKVDGSWSVAQYDDTQWPAFYRCMKAQGFQPSGADYTQQSNFGQR